MIPWIGIWAAVKLFASGVWSFLRSLPWWVYAILAFVILQWIVIGMARSAGDKAARAEMAPLLMQAHADAAQNLQKWADAEGRSQAFAKGLNDCVGAKAKIEEDTANAILDRDKRRAAAERALTKIRKELNDAYAKNADACAAQSVPDDVLRLLDAEGEADADSGRGGAGAAFRPGAGNPHQADAGAGAPRDYLSSVGAVDRVLARLPESLQ